VVLVPLDATTLDQPNLARFRASSITCFGADIINREIVNPFGDLAIIGYPLGFYDEANNLPVHRRASSASSYGVEFNGKPYFLVDANLHPGTSGSPVVNTHHTLFRRGGCGESYSLFGMHSAQFAVGGNPLGLNIVWYANLLPEIARQDTTLAWEFV
jgi:S1-C subfamily serine protease